MKRPLTLAALGLGAYWAYRTFDKPSFSFTGKKVLLTGDSRGLGLVVSRIGKAPSPGSGSRGALPNVVTNFIYEAAVRNNERGARPVSQFAR